MCCFKALKNFEKLNNMVQVILSVAIRTIQTLPDSLEKDKKEKDDENKDEKMETEEEQDGEEPQKWTTEEKEKLLTFVTKVFLMNFPSYMAYKHMVHASLEVILLFLHIKVNHWLRVVHNC